MKGREGMSMAGSPRASGRVSAPPWLGLVVAAAALFLLPAGAPLTDGDSAFYGVIARHMLETGDWQTLRYTDEFGLVDKPPLTLWFIAGSYVLFGVNEFAVRAWHSLMGAGTVLVLYATARLYYDGRTAALAGWLLLSAALFAYAGFVPQQDVPLTFFSALAFYGMARFLRGDGVVYTYVGWLAAALGFLARGPQGVVFPGLVAAIVLYGRWRARGRPRPTTAGLRSVLWHGAGGVGLFVAVAAPWFVLQYKTHGWPIIDLLLGSGQARFFEDLNRGPDVMRFWAYFPLLIVASLPWAGFVVPALVGTFRRARVSRPGTGQGGRDAESADGDRLFLWWFIVAFFLPFFTQWRVIRYLLPALPALAVLVARFTAPLLSAKTPPGAGEPAEEVASAGRGARLAAWLSLLVVVPVLLLIVAVYAQAFPEEQAVFADVLLPFLITLAAGVGGFVVFTLRGGARTGLFALVGGSLIAYGVLFASVGPYAPALLPTYDAALAINRHVEPHETVVWMGDSADPFVEFYVDRRLVHRDALDDVAAAALREKSGLGLAGDRRAVDGAVRRLAARADVLWERDDVVVVRVTPGSPAEP